MIHKTVPVKVMFDDTDEHDRITERFRVLEVEDYYLVVKDEMLDQMVSNSEYKAFLTEEGAFKYLRKCGVVREEDESIAYHESREDYYERIYVQ